MFAGSLWRQVCNLPIASKLQTCSHITPVAVYRPGARKPVGANLPSSRGLLIGGFGVGPWRGLVRQRQPVAAAPLLFANRQQRIVDALGRTSLERPDDTLAAHQQQQADD